MGDDISIEPDGQGEPHYCRCCSQASLTVWGYANRGDATLAAYYAGWTQGHFEDGIKMIIGLGRWGEGTEAIDRRSLNLHFRIVDGKPGFMVVEKEQSAFRDAEEVFGMAMSRAEASAHPSVQEFYEVADRIIEDDPRVKEFIAAMERRVN